MPGRFGGVRSGSAWAVVLTATRMLFAFLSVPLVIGAFGEERFALWRLVAGFAILASILDAGFTPYAKNRMAEARATQDDDAFVRYGRAALELGLLIAIGGVGLASLMLLPDWRPFLGAGEVVSRVEASALMASVTLVMVWIMAFSWAEAVYDAAGRLSPPRITGLVGAVVAFGGLVLSLRLGQGLVVVAVWTALPVLLGRLLLVAGLVRERTPVLRVASRSLAPERREILRRSAPFALVQAGNVGFSLLPPFFLTQVVGLSAVAQFNLAMQLTTLPMAAVAAVLPVVWPSFTVAYTEGRYDQLFRRLRTFASASTAGCALFALLLGLIGPAFTRVWTHGQVSLLPPVFLAVGLYVCVQVVAHWYGTFLQSVSDFWFQTACLVVTLIILLAGLWFTRMQASPTTTAVVMALSVTLGQSVPYAWRATHWRRRGEAMCPVS